MNNRPVHPPCPGPSNLKVRRNKSALLYLRVLDARSGEGCKCHCAACLGEVLFGPPVKYGSRMGEPSWAAFGRTERDRRYGMPKRYGLRTTVTTRRVDRVDPVRRLY